MTEVSRRPASFRLAMVIVRSVSSFRDTLGLGYAKEICCLSINLKGRTLESKQNYCAESSESVDFD